MKLIEDINEKEMKDSNEKADRTNQGEAEHTILWEVDRRYQGEAEHKILWEVDRRHHEKLIEDIRDINFYY